MNLNYAKKIVIDNYLKNKSFEYRGCRNQNERFNGYINKYYPGIFTILTTTGQIKSFSYSDIIVGNLLILK